MYSPIAHTYMCAMFLHFRHQKPETAATAAPRLVSKALPESQEASSGLNHIPPTSEEGHVL